MARIVRSNTMMIPVTKNKTFPRFVVRSALTISRRMARHGKRQQTNAVKITNTYNMRTERTSLSLSLKLFRMLSCL
eukprot:XP_001706767.1 Hypothetical protein GL50803_25894 [Giardia lamblia ATCC 50803]